MPALVELVGESGEVLFEGDFSEAELVEVGWRDRAGDIVKEAGGSLSGIADAVRASTVDLVAAIDDLAALSKTRSLTQVEVEMGIKVTGEGNVMVAKGSAGCNVTVKLTWSVDSTP